MSKISLIPEGLKIKIGYWDNDTMMAVDISSDEYYNWYDSCPEDEPKIKCIVDYPRKHTIMITLTGEVVDVITDVVSYCEDLYDEEDEDSKLSAIEDLKLVSLEFDTETKTIFAHIEEN